jgi:hypothetical protein
VAADEADVVAERQQRVGRVGGESVRRHLFI